MNNGKIWLNQKKHSILIQKFKNIKFTSNRILQSEVSHDLKHITILDINHTLIIVTIEQKFIKIQFLRNYNISCIKKLFFHYLLMFIKKKKILTFIRLLITILNNKHVIYWYQIKHEKTAHPYKNIKLKCDMEKKWSIRKKYYLVIKEKYITDICLNREKSILLIIYENTIILIFSIINLKLFSKVLFKNQYFLIIKTKKNNIFLCNSLTNDFLIINISLKKLLFIFINEKNFIRSYSITKNYLYIIMAFHKSFIRLGKLKNLQLLVILLNITSIINHLFFLNNSYCFVFSSGFKTIQFCSFLTFKLHKIFYLPQKFYFNIITVDNKDRYLFAVWDLNKILIWCIKTNLLIRALSIHYSKITFIATIDNESKIITGSLDKTIKIFNFNIKKNLLTTLKHENFIIDIYHEIQNNRIFSLTYNNYLYIWQGPKWILNKIINLELLIQKSNINIIKNFNYKNDFIKKFYYTKELLILFSVLKISILIFSNSIYKNIVDNIFIYNVFTSNNVTNYINNINLKEPIVFNHKILKKYLLLCRFSILKYHDKILIIQQLRFELHLFNINLISRLKNATATQYSNNQLIQNLRKIKKYLHEYNIFIISEILFLCDATYIKIVLSKLTYLEIYILFFILIFNVLILLKFNYRYINFLKQVIKIILKIILKKKYYFKILNVSFLLLQKYYYRKYQKIMNFILSFFSFIII
ncbi:hypothetical protein M951_chr2139 (nucleomorph) [Lotharella oceanica]|uniref:Uncharacterized protein n=1 Tax=Lotharella oceanica TaxID=641309 RepID=A0A060DH49_9EUKA|nr:hypothetical protein M951_chr2139 [Lotharella oceanica]